MEIAYQSLFKVLDAPRIRLQRPTWFRQPSQLVVFMFIMITYFLVTAGIIYDIIVEPPSVGQETDAFGRSKPVNLIIGNSCYKILLYIFNQNVNYKK